MSKTIISENRPYGEVRSTVNQRPPWLSPWMTVVNLAAGKHIVESLITEANSTLGTTYIVVNSITEMKRLRRSSTCWILIWRLKQCQFVTNQFTNFWQAVIKLVFIWLVANDFQNFASRKSIPIYDFLLKFQSYTRILGSQTKRAPASRLLATPRGGNGP